MGTLSVVLFSNIGMKLVRSLTIVVRNLTNLIRNTNRKWLNIDLYDQIHPRRREAPPRGVFSHLVFRTMLIKFRTTIAKLRTNFVPMIAKRMTDKVSMIFIPNVAWELVLLQVPIGSLPHVYFHICKWTGGVWHGLLRLPSEPCAKLHAVPQGISWGPWETLKPSLRPWSP